MKVTLPIIVMLFLVVASLTACSSIRGNQAQPMDAPIGSVPEIIGSYVLQGTDPVGADFRGSLTITAGDQPGYYKLEWNVLGNIQEGEGALTGNQIHGIWHTVEIDTTQIGGEFTYTIKVNGELHGNRQVDGYEYGDQEIAYPQR